MIPKLKKKYTFDIKSGHYIKRINEEGQTGTEQQQNANASQEQQKEESKHPINIETSEVATLKQQRDNKISQFDNDTQKIKQQLNQLQTKYSDTLAAFHKAQATETDFDITPISQIQKQMLQLKIQIENKIFEKAKVTHDANITIFQTQTKLLESFNTQVLPVKYQKLNESNMQAAKVYISVLIQPDEKSPMKGMVDVRKVFGLSGLLYGKDKTGYFVICIDQEDFDKMYQTLLDNGYTRDEIIDAIMPQVFDRRKLIN